MKITVDYKDGNLITVLPSGKSIEESTENFISSSYKYLSDFKSHFINNVHGKTDTDIEVVYTDLADKEIWNLIEFNRIDS